METEILKWWHSVYPYDPATCGHCATSHYHIDCKQHPEMSAEARRLYLKQPATPEMAAMLLSFRKKFARFYPERVK